MSKLIREQAEGGRLHIDSPLMGESLVSRALLIELTEKLLERGVNQTKVQELLIAITRLAKWVDVPAEAVLPVVAADPDDDAILACAVVGQASYLVTYDPHFDVLDGAYRGVKITKALPFLWALRGKQFLSDEV